MNDGASRSAQSLMAMRIQALGGRLTKSEAVIAQWLIRNESLIGVETGGSVAAKTGVSEITVSRFLRRLGYKGLAGLKKDLLANGTAQLAGADRYIRLLDGELGSMLRRDAEAILGLSTQITRPEWDVAMSELESADEVFVTGFQTVRGLAEDFAHRLSIVRPGVRYVAAHESGLAEWIPHAGVHNRCLVLIDTVPYAREAAPIVRLAAGQGMTVVVATDELNTWASDYTPLAFFVAVQAGAYTESVAPLAAMLNLMTHSLAARNDAAKDRLSEWAILLRNLELY